MKRLILASTSPRRKMLLEQAGIAFEIDASNYEEDNTLKLAPVELVKHLSLGKAQDVASRHNDAIVLAGDTLVFFDDRVMGKPKDKDDAKRMLEMLCGKSCKVISGFTLIDTTTGKAVSDAVEGQVFFKDYTDQVIEDYIATDEPMDKAGAFGVIGYGEKLIDHTSGDFNAIVGLPVEQIQDVLKTLE